MKLIELLYELNCIKHGQFTLKNGETSDIYIDLRNCISNPQVKRTIAEMMYDKVKETSATHVVGVPYGAIPYAAYISDAYNKKLLLTRKEQKGYGTKNTIEGEYKKGDKVLLVEDTVTTGGSLLQQKKLLEDYGLIVVDTVCLVYRGDKQAPCKYVVTLQQIKNYKKSKGMHNKYIDFLARSRIAHGFFRRVCQFIERKNSNLVIALDFENPTKILQCMEKFGKYAIGFKLHLDNISFKVSPVNFAGKLKELKEKHGFFIMDDRKFVDIGKVVADNLTVNCYFYKEIVDVVTTHIAGGSSTLQGVKSFNEQMRFENPMSVIVVKDMSSKGSFRCRCLDSFFVGLKQEFGDLICGAVSQQRLPWSDVLTFRPGINLFQTYDDFGQIHQPVNEIAGECDIFIVGRSITESTEPLNVIGQYLNTFRTLRV